MGGTCQKEDTYKVCDVRPYFRNMPVVWIIGPPGSGKSAQCANAVYYFDFDCIRMGPLLREYVQKMKKKKEQLEMQALFDSGELMPNEMTLQVLHDAMKKISYSCVGVIVDDFPREVEQAQLFRKNIVEVDIVLVLKCPVDVLVKRFKKRAERSLCTIDEDIINAYKIQIELYMRMMTRILSKFPANKIIECNGNQRPLEVFKEIRVAVSKAAWIKHCERAEINDSKAPIIWVLGGPGSGKGTQCERIVAKFKFSHFSTGDLLRDEVASDSPKGQELHEIMMQGKLVPNEIVLALLDRAMYKVVQTAVGFLVDGYPREPSQGPEFEKFIAPVDLILYFECSNKILVARILKRAAEAEVKRDDDNVETLKTRIAIFRKNTEKILKQYSRKVKRINAERSPDEIFKEVKNIIQCAIVFKKS